MITGQLFFRDTEVKTKDGRPVKMVIGLVAFPKDTPLKGECQYTVASNELLNDMIGNPLLEVHLDTEKDLSEESEGVRVGDLLTRPLWRV